MQPPVDATLRQHIGTRVFSGRPSWAPLASGSINDVWLATNHEGAPAAVVRVGPSAEVIQAGPSWMRINALACEQHVFGLVRSMISELPATIAAGFLPGDRPWVVQEHLMGAPLSSLLPDLALKDQQHIWRAVGSLLRRLHQIPAPWFGTPDGRQRFADWHFMVSHDVAGLLADAHRMGLSLAPFQSLVDLVSREKGALLEVAHPRVVHSDLDPRHIFVVRRDAGWDITGLIDWEYGRYADPGSEGLLIAMVDRSNDDPVRSAFLEGYGTVEATPAALARRRIYRGIALGWDVTDAHRCHDLDRFLHVIGLFNRWALGSFWVS